MVMAEDATQDMYGRCRLWTDGSLRGSGLVGSPFQLEGSYRFPSGLVPHLRSFVQSYLQNSTTNLPAAIEGELFDRARLRWIQIGATDDSASAVVDAVVDLTKIGPEFPVTWSDITLLVGSHAFGLRCVKALEDKGVHVAHVFDQDRRSRKALKLGRVDEFAVGDCNGARS